jgi:hypothetical protein
MVTTFLQKALLAVKHKSNKEFADLFGATGSKDKGKLNKSLEYLRQIQSQGYIVIPNLDGKITLTDKGKAELAKIGQ